MRIYYWLLNKFYNFIRPLFVNEIDLNEEYICCWCSKPVLKRWLYCSFECEDKASQQ